MKPDLLLFTYAKVFYDDYGHPNGIWRFVLKAQNGGIPFEAFDHEDGWHVDRLSLLSVVRGLESLEQPSNVTLYSSSRYVTRGFESSLRTWKKNNWMWERFGEEVPVKNHDLWKRVDRALAYHHVDSRYYRAGKKRPSNRIVVSEYQEPTRTSPSTPSPGSLRLTQHLFG